RHRPVPTLQVPIAGHARSQVGSARVTLGEEQSHDVAGRIVHRRNAGEIDEQVEGVALDTGEAFLRGQSDHECTQYNSRPFSRPLSYAGPHPPLGAFPRWLSSSSQRTEFRG